MNDHRPPVAWPSCSWTSDLLEHRPALAAERDRQVPPWSRASIASRLTASRDVGRQASAGTLGLELERLEHVLREATGASLQLELARSQRQVHGPGVSPASRDGARVRPVRRSPYASSTRVRDRPHGLDRRSISSAVLKAPRLKRTAPRSIVPRSRWTSGAQWTPTRTAIPKSPSRIAPDVLGVDAGHVGGQDRQVPGQVVGAVQGHRRVRGEAVAQAGDERHLAVVERSRSPAAPRSRGRARARSRRAG